MLKRNSFRIRQVLLAAVLLPACAFSTDWRVGPGRALTLPSQAAALAKDGDTVTIEAGSYVDCAFWTQNDLLIRGEGGYAVLRDKCCGGKAIWVIQGRNTTVRHIEFTGAAVPDRNGAGIRQEGPDLLVQHCYFHDNENGILTGANKESSIRVEHTHFDNNGHGDGYSHNMYIGHVGSFEISSSWTHRARVGHNIKSRADSNRILYNRISNEDDGTASRDIDLPNGGYALIMGNVLQHGPRTQNSNTCGYGMEGLSNASKTLLLVNNTFVSQRGAGAFVQMPGTGVDSLVMINNLFAGTGSLLSGTASLVDTQANLLLRDPAAAAFADAAGWDYRPTLMSPTVDAGIDSEELRPLLQYKHPADSEPRIPHGAPDIGAFEFTPSTGCETAPMPPAAVVESGPVLYQNHPNPCASSTLLAFRLTEAGGVIIRVCDALGRDQLPPVRRTFHSAGQHGIRLDTSPLRCGIYFCILESAGLIAARTLTVLR